MQLSLSVKLAFPEIKDFYDVGYRDCPIGRVWLARDLPGTDRPWEWLLSLPMDLPESSKGRAKSMNDAMGALATEFGRLLTRTDPARLQRAFDFAHALERKPGAAPTITPANTDRSAVDPAGSSLMFDLSQTLAPRSASATGVTVEKAAVLPPVAAEPSPPVKAEAAATSAPQLPPEQETVAVARVTPIDPAISGLMSDLTQSPAPKGVPASATGATAEKVVVPSTAAKAPAPVEAAPQPARSPQLPPPAQPAPRAPQLPPAAPLVIAPAQKSPGQPAKPAQQLTLQSKPIKMTFGPQSRPAPAGKRIVVKAQNSRAPQPAAAAAKTASQIEAPRPQTATSPGPRKLPAAPPPGALTRLTQAHVAGHVVPQQAAPSSPPAAKAAPPSPPAAKTAQPLPPAAKTAPPLPPAAKAAPPSPPAAKAAPLPPAAKAGPPAVIIPPAKALQNLPAPAPVKRDATPPAPDGFASKDTASLDDIEALFARHA